MKFIKLLVIVAVYVAGLWRIPLLITQFGSTMQESGVLVTVAWSLGALFTALGVLEDVI